jgi:glycosyltransferase involved in cell wall biosynthesis
MSGLVPWALARMRSREVPTSALSAPARPDLEPGLSVVMAAHDERDHLSELLPGLAGFAEEVVVVDAESTDGSAEVAARFARQVIHTTNKPMLEINKNLAMAAATREWVLVIDPDERISDRLRREIRDVVDGRAAGAAVAGYWMPRRNYILGKWLRTMGLYPAFQLRLVRNGVGRFDESSHHLPMSVGGARTGYLSGDLIHLSDRSVAEIAGKRTRYAEFAATQMFEDGVPFRLSRLILTPVTTFARQYLLLGGFLEGLRGLIYATLSAYGAGLRQLRLWELRRGAARVTKRSPGS